MCDGFYEQSLKKYGFRCNFSIFSPKDLDATLWTPELFMMSGRPYKRNEKGDIFDRSGRKIGLFPDARRGIVTRYTQRIRYHRQASSVAYVY